ALRRVQKKRDPITVEITNPNDLEATTRQLPTIRVFLMNLDEEMSPVAIALGGDYRSGRKARWRFVVHDPKGNLLPQRQRESMVGGGMFEIGELAHGEVWGTSLRMDRFVKITEPGEYTVRILYHDRETIADLEDVTGLIVCGSRPFKLK